MIWLTLIITFTLSLALIFMMQKKIAGISSWCEDFDFTLSVEQE